MSIHILDDRFESLFKIYGCIINFDQLVLLGLILIFENLHSVLKLVNLEMVALVAACTQVFALDSFVAATLDKFLGALTCVGF